MKLPFFKGGHPQTEKYQVKNLPDGLESLSVGQKYLTGRFPNPLQIS